ncbi:MAG: GNAT family N-acetyltransferase [Clostridia bacterium]|nr:GNAT family N-acetyltransferase [Clostridia bacterium]
MNHTASDNIHLTAIPVHGGLKEYGEIRKLMDGAFPKDEQTPMWMLRLSAIRKNVDFLAYYDGNEFCGISYTMNSDALVFILYLAVRDSVRQKGYGSAILQSLKQRYPNKPLALNIEPLCSDSVNYDQRVKRYGFYAKNGFVDTRYQLSDRSCTYQVLATTEQFSITDYVSAIKRLSLGLYSMRVQKQDE